MLRGLICISALCYVNFVLATPRYYQEIAQRYGVESEKLYAIAVTESGVDNGNGYVIPYPWSVSVNGRFYRFKNKYNLFRYLKSNMHKVEAITYGVIGKTLRPQSDSDLWESLSVEKSLVFLAQKLKKFNCNSQYQCISEYRAIQKKATKAIILNNKQPALKPNFYANYNINLIVAQVSKQQNIAPELLHAVISQESAYRVNAKSHAGAMGLMQLMPSTARYLGLKPSEYYDPYKNIDAGARYLKEQLQTFNGNLELALAAYNAGPGAVRKHNGIPPYRETKKYVPKVLGYYKYFKRNGVS